MTVNEFRRLFGIEAGIAVAFAESDDALNGTQPVDGVDGGEFRDDRHRTGADLFGLGATPTHRAHTAAPCEAAFVQHVPGRK
uniref:hypothetical protein n=1 Tax=Mycobacterium pinniadriaticum TaxID=2994102 RepID=UPI0038996258